MKFPLWPRLCICPNFEVMDADKHGTVFEYLCLQKVPWGAGDFHLTSDIYVTPEPAATFRLLHTVYDNLIQCA
jgi:hypothetical protein